MLGSISYGGESAILAVEQRPSTDASRAGRIAAEATGTLAKVADEGSRSRLLRTELLSKALYEINCEAEFRPTWVSGPVKGALALIDEMELTQ